MKPIVKLLSVLRGSRPLWSVLAGLAIVLGVPAASLAQNVVYKNSGALTGSLANTLQGDLQVANGRTLTISSYGSIIIGSGATLSFSPSAIIYGSISLSGAVLISPTISGSATITTSGNVTLNGITSATSLSATTATISTATISSASITTATITSATITSATITTASISTLSVSSQTVSGSMISISPSGGIGYGAGAGSTVTQSSNKSTAVTINAISGHIVLNNASLGAGATVSFTMTNSAIAANDLIFTNVNSVSYSAKTTNGFTGSAVCTITNLTASPQTDAPTISFIVFKGAAN